MKRRISISMLVAALVYFAVPAFAYTNPANLTAGQYTPIAVSSTPVSVSSGLYFLRRSSRLEVQNQCSCAVTIQLNGGTAVFGQQGFVLQPGQTKSWTAGGRAHPSDPSGGGGAVPQGPFSFVTQGGMSCPDITCTPDTGNGVNVFEILRSDTGM